MGTKMGRPTDNPATNQLRIRLSDKDLEMLNECSEVLELTKSDVVRLGIKKVFEGIQK